MEDSALLKIALACSVIGITFLYLYSSSISIPENDNAFLGEQSPGDTVALSGRVTEVSQKQGLCIIRVSREDSIPVVAFGDTGTGLSVGDNVRVTGKLDEYDGEDEIIADKIEKG